MLILPVFKHAIFTYSAPLFTGLRTMGRDMTAAYLQACILEAFDSADDVISKAAPGLILNKNGDLICEVMTHPGHVTGSQGGCGDGPDDFSQSSDREYEMTLLMSEEMRQFYDKENIELASFDDVNRMKF